MSEPSPSTSVENRLSPERIRATVLAVLGRIAPECDASAITANAELRAELDLDSMDFLNFAIGLHDAFGIEIPEADYRRLATLEGCVAYVAARKAG